MAQFCSKSRCGFRRAVLGLALLAAALPAQQLERVRYNNPGLTVDLGTGLWSWPLPMDYDGDGDLDLVVTSGGKPFAWTYFFENPGGDGKMPVFKPGKKIAEYRPHVQRSPDGSILSPGAIFPDFVNSGFAHPVPLGVELADIYPSNRKTRASHWSLADYEGDGVRDLIVGVGDWQDYGWDDAYNADGEWTNGPLHGYVFILKNTGTEEAPAWGPPTQLLAGGQPAEVYGWPSPNFADFDGDGDLDLICGEFLDGFTYFENTGTRTKPVYQAGKRLTHQGKPVRMDLQMITPTAIDWDGDGDPDLIVGDEDGRVAFVENLGDWEFAQPAYFQQEAEYVKFGALVTPVSFDWDGDGDEDIVAGNTAGHIGFIENLDGGNPPKWAAPVLMEADGAPIRIQAGPTGSIQGPAEAKWGYTTLSVADWDGDDLPDLVVNSIWGKVVWYRNTGSRKKPALAAAQPVLADLPTKPKWNWWTPGPREFVTQWRTTPVAVDWNEDGRVDLLALDEEGYLALFERGETDGRLSLRPGKRIFRTKGPSGFSSKGDVVNSDPGPLRLNNQTAGRSGRRKLALVDWDGDGRLDLLTNSTSTAWFRNLGDNQFEHQGNLTSEELAGHTTSPTTVDWDGDGVRDLLIGAEDGYLYHMPNPRTR